MKLLILIIFLFQFSVHGSSQDREYPLERWAKMLSVKKDIKQTAFREVITSIRKASGEPYYIILDKLEAMAGHSDMRLQIRLKLLRATLHYAHKRPPNVSRADKVNQIDKLLQKALLWAYQTDDKMLIADICDFSGRMMYNEGRFAHGVMYCLNAIEIQDNLGVENFYLPGYLRYIFGLLMYRTQEYRKAIDYSVRGIRLQLGHTNYFFLMNAWNTVGLSYDKIGKSDSAMIAFDKAMTLARKNKNFPWTGIVSGNIAHILFAEKRYDSAKKLLEYEYAQNIKGNLMDDAANSLQWLARTNLRLGHKEEALRLVNKAHSVLKQNPQRILDDYRRNIYQTYAEIYHSLNMPDSAILYSNLFHRLNDSLNKVVLLARTEIARIKLYNQKSVFKMQQLKNQTEQEKNRRNQIIAVLVFVFIITILLLNRQRLKFRYKQVIALEQKKMIESEAKSTREQLEFFIRNLKEKTHLIQELQGQINSKQINAEQQKIFEDLVTQNILTEEDWQNFKHLYEKLHPGFFVSMKESVADITAAELRLAALTRLHLTPKEIASILGVSVNSVHKLRQRLRQRLQLSTNDDLGQSIKDLSA